MRIWTDGDKDYGEWHFNKRSGFQKVEDKNGNIWWGEFKDD